MRDAAEVEGSGPLVFGVRRGWFAEPTLHGLLEGRDGDDDFDDLVRRQEFGRWAVFGPLYEGFGITVFRRRNDVWPPFLVEVDTSHGVGQASDYVYAEDLPSVMALLRDWVPVAQEADIEIELDE